MVDGQFSMSRIAQDPNVSVACFLCSSCVNLREHFFFNVNFLGGCFFVCFDYVSWLIDLVSGLC